MSTEPSAPEAIDEIARLTAPIYDAAAVHALIEDVKDTGFQNRYTSVSYGRAVDMRSVPIDADVKSYGRLIAVRVRLDRAAAEHLVADAEKGRATVAEFSVQYALDEVVTGFRPRSTFMTNVQQSPFQTSLWTRERIGSLKTIGNDPLTAASLWSIIDRLAFLSEARWSGIPLQRYPEKLGDLDEWWPSPIQIGSRRDPGPAEVRIVRDLLDLPDERITFSGTIVRDGLVAAHLDARGRGPHRIPTDADGYDATVLVDGIPVDQSAGFYVRALVANTNIMSHEPWTVQPYKARPAMSFQGAASHQEAVIAGSPRPTSVRRDTWALGDQFRAPGFRDDGERVYDPTSDTNSVTINLAFSDLRVFGSDQNTRVIRVADPYALDERAMEAIATTATRSNRIDVLEIYTMFSKPPKEKADAATRRADAEQIAATFARRYGIKVVCYEVQKLHDRFLAVGNRLWHVGPSFNTLGQEMTAIVEMRDPRRVAQVIGYLDGARTAGPLWSKP